MLGQQKAQMEQARDQEFDELYSRVATEALGILDQAASELLAEDKGFGFLYNREKSSLENYQSRPLLQGYFHSYLKRYAPEHFEPIRQRYEAQITALDAQIAALQPRGT